MNDVGSYRYVAQLLGILEVKVVAATEAEAIAQVAQILAQWLASASPRACTQWREQQSVA